MSAYSEVLHWACQSAGHLVEKWVGLKVVSWVDKWVASKAEMLGVWLVVQLVD
jgi:type III secretory pathway component EscT